MTTQQQRFWAKVKKAGCWIWTGSKMPNGYGHFEYDGKTQLSHRIAYELIKGKIPKGMTLDHICRYRDCVNPDHLEVVTQKENVLRGIGITAKNAKKTHCPKGHEYTKANTRLDKYNRRYCRKCQSQIIRKPKSILKEGKD